MSPAQTILSRTFVNAAKAIITRTSQPTVVFVGGTGNMGTAMIPKFAKKFPEHRFVTAGSTPKKLGFTSHVTSASEIEDGVTDVLIIGAKPQVAFGPDAVCAKYAPALISGGLAISIAAGVPINTIARNFPAKTPIVRAMPNLCASIGESMTAIVCNEHVTEEQRAFVKEMFESIGRIVFIEEKQMDAFTAAAGSGPAFVAQAILDYAQAITKIGFTGEESVQIAMQVFSGTVKTARTRDLDMSGLKKLALSVQSNGGVTAAAFDSGALELLGPAFVVALKTAAARGAELSAAATQGAQPTPLEASPVVLAAVDELSKEVAIQYQQLQQRATAIEKEMAKRSHAAATSVSEAQTSPLIPPIIHKR